MIPEELPTILTLPRLHELAAPLYTALMLGGAIDGHSRREDTHTGLIMAIGSTVVPILTTTLGVGVVLWTYENRLTIIGCEWLASALGTEGLAVSA